LPPRASGHEQRRPEVVAEGDLPLQRGGDGPHAGSWDPDPVWGGHGGRVYATAVAALTLEVYYRYLPIHQRGGRIAATP
jgi:hypothetical protein